MTIKNENKVLKIATIVFYCFLAVVIILGAYMFYLDKYTVYLRSEEVIIDKGSNYTVDLLPEYFEYFNYDNYIYKSENKDVAIVDKYGQITALAEGETYIDVRFKHDYKNQKLKVKVENMDIDSIDVKDTFKVNKNDTQRITVNVNQKENVGTTLNYEMVDEDIAKVDFYGNVTGVNKGTTKLIISSPNGITKEVEVIVEEKKYEIQELELTQKLIVLNVGEERKLKVETVPSNADTSSLQWKSNNSKIVSVNEKGKIKAISPGETKVIVKTNKGLDAIVVVRVNEKKKEETVKPTKPTKSITPVKPSEPNEPEKPKIIEATDIVLNKSKIELTEGSNAKLSATISPSNVTNKTMNWTSDNTNIATIDSKGNVTAKKEGTTTIRVKTSNGKTATCEVVVKKPVVIVTNLTISSKVIQITEGESTSVLATIEPDNASDKSIKWTSSNTAIANVSSTGVITGVKEGSAKITAISKSNNSISSSINIVVKPKIIDVTSITISNTSLSMKKGETKTLKATINPNNATNKTIKWSSSDSSIVSVDQNGKITANKKGSATITVKSNNNKSAKCTVNVTEPKPSDSYSKVNYKNFKWTFYTRNTGPLKDYEKTFNSYAVYAPDNIADLNGVNLPLIIWLHGASEKGAKESQFLKSGLLKVVRDWNNYKLEPIPAIIVAPLATSEWWAGNKENHKIIYALIKYAKNKYKIDSNRIVLMGHSMGGYGTVQLPYEMKDLHLYAAVPMSLKTRQYKGEEGKAIYSKIRMWGYGEIINHKDFYDWIGQSGHFTYYKGASHGSVPERALTEDKNKDGVSDLMHWLFYEE